MCSSIRSRVNACVQALAKQMAEIQRPELLKASRVCNISDAIDTQLSSFAPPRFSRILGVNVPAYKYLPARIASRFASESIRTASYNPKKLVKKTHPRVPICTDETDSLCRHCKYEILDSLIFPFTRTNP